MAHLPETLDPLDESLPASDPVVRAPKKIVVLPDPPSYARRTVLAVAGVALLIGAALGFVGIGIVYVAHHPPALTATGPRTTGPTDRADAGAPATFVLEARADAGSGRPAGPEANYVVAQQRLGRGRTLAQVLKRLGADNDLAARVTRAFRGLINMRMLQPDDVIVAMRDPADSSLKRVEYRRSDTQVWAATVGADRTVTAERIEVVKTSERLVTGFLVGDSLEAALASAHLQPDIIPRLQEVFAALDLGREIRRGDSVRLVVHEERLNGQFFRYGRVEAVDYRGAMGHRRAFWQDLGHAGDFFDGQGFTRERGPLRSPLDNPRMTSPFNPRRMHPVLHRIMPHQGTDFGAPVGTPVYAAADGVLLSAGREGPTGNLVRVAHPALGIETGYAHLSRFAPGLHAGMRIRARQLVGYVGNTGRSTGPHLHFACKRNGEFFDCMTMWGSRRSVPDGSRAEFEQRVARLSGELDALRFDGEAPAPPPDDAVAAGPPAAPAPGAPAAPGALAVPAVVQAQAAGGAAPATE